MRVVSSLVISSSIIILFTSLAFARDYTRRHRVSISNEKIEKLRERIIAARRARLQRQRRPSTTSPGADIVATNTSPTTTKPSCPGGCICPVTNDVRCNSKSLERIPQGLPHNVNKLDLGMNYIATFTRKDFSNISVTLLNLYLHNNSIKSIGNGNFAELKKLQLLRLSHNKIQEIRKSSLQGMIDLQWLYLDHNRLSFIHPLAFRGLTKLQTLQLEGNLLSQTHRDVFITLEFHNYFKFSSLTNLNLQQNKFRYLPRHVFDHVTNESSVFLGFNPWDCSCQSKWLKKKVVTLTNDRCGAMNSASDCPICESPVYAKDRSMSDVDMTCSHNPQHGIDSIQAETDQVLFQHSGLSVTTVSFLFTDNDRSVLGAECNLAEMPSTVVRKEGDAGSNFSASFEGLFRCEIQPLDSTLTTDIYGHREFSLISRERRHVQQDKLTKAYVVEENGVENPFTDVSVTTESEFLLASRSTLKFLGRSDQDSEQGDLFDVKLSTSFTYSYDPKRTKFSKEPWLEVRSPDPSNIDVTILQAGKQFSRKCKAVGQPKPNIAWVLPSGELIHSGEKSSKFAVQKSGKLVIRSVSAEDSGIYQCIATIHNPANRSETVGSDSAASKIKVVEPTQDSFSPTDLSPETDQEMVERGDSWTSRCHIESLYDATTAWVTPDNRILVGDSSYRHGQVTTFRNGTIAITDFRKANGGLYRCVGVNVEGDKDYSVYVSLASLEDDAVESVIIEFDDDLSEEPTFTESDLIPSNELDFEEDDMDPYEDQIINEVISDFDDELPQNHSTMTNPPTTFKPTTTNFVDENDDPMSSIDRDVPEIKTPDLMAGEVIEIDIDDEEDYYDEGLEENPSETGEIAETTTPSKDIEIATTTQGLEKSKNSKSSLTPIRTSPAKDSPQTTAESIYSNSNPTNQNQAGHTPMKSSLETTAESKYSNFLKTPQHIIRHPIKIDSTFRTHLDKNDMSSPTQSADTIAQPDSPKFPAQTSGLDFDDEITLPESTSKSIISGKLPVFPTQQEGTSSNFQPQDQYLELKAKPDGTASPTSPQINDMTPSDPDTTPTRALDVTREEQPQNKVNRTQIDTDIEFVPDLIDPGVLFPDSTTPFALYAEEEQQTNRVPMSVEDILGSSTSKDALDQKLPQVIDPGILFPDSSNELPEEENDLDVTIIISNTTEQVVGATVTPDLGKSDAKTASATGLENDQQVIDSEALIPDVMYDIDGNKDLINYDRPVNQVQQLPSQSDSASSTFDDISEIDEPELDIGKVQRSSDLNSTTSRTLAATKTTLATTKPITATTNSNYFEETMATSPQSHSVSRDTSTHDVVEPPIITVAMPTSSKATVEEDPDSLGVYEVLNMPAGKITRPAIQRQGRDKIFAREHGRVLLPCMPTGMSPLWSWTFTWTLPNQNIYRRPGRIVSPDWSKYIHRNGSLLLTRLESDDRGNYDCIAVNERNNVEYHTYISLEILERLRIHNPKHEQLQAKTGSDVMIPCDATGTPHPSITWETPWGATLDITSYVDDLEVLWNGTLRIFNMKPGLRGSYTCYAKNGHELQMRTVSISIIMQRPVFINPTSGMVAVRPGGTISLECKAEGYPVPAIQWMLARSGMIRPNEAIFSGSRYMPKYRVEKDGTLIIRRANYRDVGNYHCVITNYLGRSASTVKLVLGVRHH